MAFNYSDLRPLHDQGEPRLWGYKTLDGSGEVMTPGYFNDARSMLRQGDFVFVNADIDDEMQSAVLVVVHSSHNEGVRVSDITGFGISALLQDDEAA